MAGVICEQISTITSEGMHQHISVVRHPPIPLPGYQGVRITALGIGSYGAKVVRRLVRNIPGITCLEINFTPCFQGNTDAAAALKDVHHNDLLFICSGFDEQNCESLFDQFADAARKSGVLAVGLTSDEDGMNRTEYGLCEHARHVDTLFRVSAVSLSGDKDFSSGTADQNAGWTEYSLRHTMSVIIKLITVTGMICIDFADIAFILRSSKMGRMGVGVSNDASPGKGAALSALGRLNAQQVNMTNVAGVIACISGSSMMSMDDYEDASKVIHEHVHEDTNVVVGLLVDEHMGHYVKVTILTVEKVV